MIGGGRDRRPTLIVRVRGVQDSANSVENRSYCIGTAAFGSPGLSRPRPGGERQWATGWPFDKLRTGFSMDAGVRIEARDRKGLESQGQGVALSGAPRMQRLAWASRGEQVVYSLAKPGPLGQTALSLAFLDRLAALVPPPPGTPSPSVSACSPVMPPRCSDRPRRAPDGATRL